MVNVFSSWWQYLALEGGLYGGACVISIIVVVLLYHWYRRTKFVIAGEQLIRAGELFQKAYNHPTQGTETRRIVEITDITNDDGQLLINIGNHIFSSQNQPYNEPINFKFLQLSSNSDPQVSDKVKGLLGKAKHCLENANSQLDDDNIVKENLTNLINTINVKFNCSNTTCSSCSNRCQSFPFAPPLLSFYSVLFPFTVKEVVTSEIDHGWTQHQYLFGGYICCPQSMRKLHAYFISMLWLIVNLFAISFIDNFFYKKSTVCNDPNSEDDDFLCFDVTKPNIYSEPKNCSDPANYDVKVICYRASYNFGNAISLATWLAKFALLAIQVSFAVTLWCLKCGKKCARVLNWGLVALYCAFLAYFVIANIVLKDVVELNIFYGYRMMRLAMVVWGLVTLLLIAIFSPYTWLTDKTNSEETYHLPSYNRDKAKLCNAQNSQSDRVTPTTFTPTQNSNNTSSQVYSTPSKFSSVPYQRLVASGKEEEF